MVNDSNPSGTITINDLELAGIILQVMALTRLGPTLTNKHIALYYDNTSAVSWTYKMRTSASTIAARLIRLLGLLILDHGLSPLSIDHIKGDDNDMADRSSRAFQHGKYFQAQTNLTQYFTATFPLPQGNSWTEYTMPTALTSRVTSCLRGDPLTMAVLRRPRKPGKNTGTTRQSIPPNSTATLSSQTPPTSTKPSSPQPLLLGSGQVSTDAANKLRWARSQRRWHPSPRPSNWKMNRAQSTKKGKHTSPP